MQYQQTQWHTVRLNESLVQFNEAQAINRLHERRWHIHTDMQLRWVAVI